MTPPVMYVYGLPDSPRYGLVRGPLRAWLRDNRIPATWRPPLRGWLLRQDTLGDAIARAELDGIAVKMRGPLK